MDITILQYIFSVISGVIVGFSLGLIGGGGSILAIPLLIYFVGIRNPHLVIGTTALAVGINALINVYSHLRKKNVNLRTGAIFTVFGVIGVLIGTTLGLITPGGKLLFLFSFLMMIIGAYMFVTKCRTCKNYDAIPGNAKNQDDPPDPPKKGFWQKTKLEIFGILAGFASGYFGIGGGFLIVPALLYSADITMNLAVGTSLLSVGTFGLVTALRYGIAGKVLVPIALLYVLGGIFGGFAGARLSSTMKRSTLRRFFSLIIIVVGIYMAIESYAAVF
ncbi:sulfite exporter TauE/SafE family protein [Thermoplasma sp.]|uniref:sulfite exporter TauE/SafE family protein n=1 Tax=Thermoplasma sp. TaxID=1973142 RepID=UPI00127D38E2|nr:sulfite exporter TauE/SafE family protein [Thermoplasma sp.]KAA8923476.1 MAG: sulfite exporter TauE/SafE family protein [Thermoplasma sp.]